MSTKTEFIQIASPPGIKSINWFIMKFFSLTADAFKREKQVKGGSRLKKIKLIESINPDWTDLTEKISQNKGEELNRIISLLRPGKFF